jgi:hypothetical protein
VSGLAEYVHAAFVLLSVLGMIVRLDRRAYSPVLRQADLPNVTVPWLGRRTSATNTPELGSNSLREDRR